VCLISRLYKSDFRVKSIIYLSIYLLLKTIIMNKIVLESAKGVKGGKVQLTFAQVVNTGNNPTNVLGLLNASDDRFNQSKPRYAWLSAQPADVNKLLGLDLSLNEGEELQLDMVDPRFVGFESQPLNIQINETTKGNDFEVANFDTRAKRAGKDGDFIMHNGMYIYVRTSVVLGEAKHAILTDTTRVETSAASAIAAALAK
jgi:hypothetical protein